MEGDDPLRPKPSNLSPPTREAQKVPPKTTVPPHRDSYDKMGFHAGVGLLNPRVAGSLPHHGPWPHVGAVSI